MLKTYQGMLVLEHLGRPDQESVSALSSLFEIHFLICAMSLSLSLRPVHGSPLKYNFFIRGAEMDLDKVASSTLEELTTFARELSGIQDLEFGELVWIGHWKPNIRMVDKFGEGRVFIAGGGLPLST